MCESPLEGSVRKGGNRARITAQLIDATTGAHLWADRFDGLLEEVFELQDQVAIGVAGVRAHPPPGRDRTGAAQATREPRRLRLVPTRASLCLHIATLRRTSGSEHFMNLSCLERDTGRTPNWFL